MKQIQPNWVTEFKNKQTNSKQNKPIQRTHLVGEAGLDSRWNALFQVGVLKDDSRILAPQLQGELLAVGSTQLCDPLGCGLAPREGNEGYLRMGHQGLADPGPRPKHNIYHTWWDTWTGNRTVSRSVSR